MTVAGSALSPATSAEEPFGRVARLAALVLGAPSAFVTVAAGQPFSRRTSSGSRSTAGRRSPAEQSLCQQVIHTGDKLVIEDARLDPRTVGSYQTGPAAMIAWAGFPVRGPDRYGQAQA
jgi:phosphoserine phosphatase RsbU/P